MRERSRTGPVAQVPAGMTTRPPPFAAAARIAAAKAAVLSVVPPATAPWSVNRTSRRGMRGRRRERTIRSAALSAASSTSRGGAHDRLAASDADGLSASASATVPPTAARRSTSRRLVFSSMSGLFSFPGRLVG